MLTRLELKRSASVTGVVSLFAVCVCAVVRLANAYAPDSLREPAWYVQAIQSKAATARQYAFDATIEVAGKRGEGLRESAAVFAVRTAVAPGGKYLFWFGDKRSPRYLIVSDGQLTWAYSPAEKKYIEIEAIATLGAADPAVAFPSGVSKENVDPVLSSAIVIPILARLDLHSADVVDMKVFGADSTNVQPSQPPVLTILSNRDEAGRQRLLDVAIDPMTLEVLRMNWSISAINAGEPRFALLNVTFSRLALGDPVPASYFTFSPGKAEKVDDLPLPGLDGRAFAGKPSPDFVFQMPNRQSISLADLRGKTVILSFTAPDCTPCSKQAAMLAGLQKEYKTQGLIVLEAGLDNARLHGLFQVNFAPAVVIIDRRGIVASYLYGVRKPSELRTVLGAAGL
jgi:thiol-disulfide isomerase/thioredoxin